MNISRRLSTFKEEDRPKEKESKKDKGHAKDKDELEITCDGQNKSDTRIEEILRRVETNEPRLHKVDLWWRGLGKKYIKPISNAFLNNITIKELDLSGNSLKPDGAKLLAKSLLSNRTLIKLSIHNNDIGKSGAKAFANLLKVNSVLKYLEMGGNGIGRQGVDYLIPVLSGNNSSLLSISLSFNNIKRKGADSLATLVSENKSLTFLDISDNLLTNAGAKRIYLALQNNTTLRHLNISYNENGLPIARVGLKAINDLLVRNRTNSNIPDENEIVNTNIDAKSGHETGMNNKKILGWNENTQIFGPVIRLEPLKDLKQSTIKEKDSFDQVSPCLSENPTCESEE